MEWDFGDEEERGPEISNILNGKLILYKCRLLFNLKQRNDISHKLMY